jgi:hypothetical protein
MTTRFGWVLNLDAELELSRGRPGYVAQRKLLSQLAEHGQSSRRLLGPADVLLEPGVRPSVELVGRAWCPTPQALDQLASCGVTPEPHPDAATLRRVNHRLFAHALGGGLADQRYITGKAELTSLLGEGARASLLKRPLGFAGRGQLRVQGELSLKQWSWVDASLERDGLLVEPQVMPSLELSVHGFVWRDGRYELGRICKQRVSSRGVFQAIELAQPSELAPEEASAFLQRAELVARALHHAGYFGPFGIDGYRYTLEGKVGFCTLSEINARYTLGFVTGFPRHPSELSLT